MHKFVECHEAVRGRAHAERAHWLNSRGGKESFDRDTPRNAAPAARIRARLDAPAWLPAPAQGAIAIECRDDDPGIAGLFAALDDAGTRRCVEAERAMNRALHGSCHVPVAALAKLDGDTLSLAGLVGSARDGAIVRADARGPAHAPDALGIAVADLLLAQGARALIDAVL